MAVIDCVMLSPLAFSDPALQDVTLLAGLSADERKAVGSRVSEILREAQEILRVREIPSTEEMLRLVLESMIAEARVLLMEKHRAEAEKRHAEIQAMSEQRLPMTLISTDRDWKPLRVRPGDVVPVITRPQWHAFRVEEIEIHGDPSRWLVRDIKVGNQSQILRQGSLDPNPIPGERFRKGGIMSEIRLATCQTAMDLALMVEYVGPDAEGEVFGATLVGVAAT